jgi:hypothetical protein
LVMGKRKHMPKARMRHQGDACAQGKARKAHNHISCASQHAPCLCVYSRALPLRAQPRPAVAGNDVAPHRRRGVHCFIQARSASVVATGASRLGT